MSLLGSLAQGLPVPMVDNPTADFTDTPWWLSLVKALLIFVFLLVNTLLVIWFERRVIGRMQQRPGPNRAGPFGLLQTLADGVKLALKEDLTPKNADKVVFLLAPVIAGAMAFVSFAIIPLGPTVSMFGHRTPLQLTDLPVAVLLRAGRGRRRGLRHRAGRLVVRLDVPAARRPALDRPGDLLRDRDGAVARRGVHVLRVDVHLGDRGRPAEPVVHPAGLLLASPSTSVTMVGETNRLPFDLAEGEGELTGGFHTEYSSLKFAMFFLGEYVNMFTVSALATTMFLGGWRAPPRIAAINHGMFNHGWWGLLWFVIKLWMFMFFFVWLRGSLPRVRYDQFMRFGWKFLIPVTLVWVVAVAFIRGAQLSFFGGNTRPATVIVVGVIAVLALAVAWVWDGRRAAAMVPEERLEEIDPFAGGYPVPPLPGQRLREPEPGRRRGGRHPDELTDQEATRG